MRVRHLFSQPFVGSATLGVALSATLLAWWVGWRDSISPADALLALFLVANVVLAYRFPIQVRHETKVYMTSVPLYVMAVSLHVPLAMTAIGAGKLLGEYVIRRQTGNYLSDIGSQAGRWIVIGGAGSLVAHGAPASSVLGLGGAALVLWLGEIVTSPLLLSPATGESPLAVMAMVAREAGLVEAAQQLVGMLGAMAAMQGRGALVLLFLPTALVYLSFKTAKDIHERTRHLLASVVETSADPILVLAADGAVITANRQAALAFDFRHPDDMLGIDVATLGTPDDGKRLSDDVRSIVRRRQPAKIEYGLQTRTGHGFLAELSWSVIIDRTGHVSGVTCVARDVTDARRAEQALEHRALHDALTGLPNRVLFHQRVESALQRALEDSQPFTLFLIDLDRFKAVNDTYGHRHGDVVLQHVSTRLHGVLRASDTVARLGGDEFAVLLPGTSPDGARTVADKILKALDEPFVVEGIRTDIGGSIGCATYPEHGDGFVALMHCADIAMYRAKRSRSGYHEFSVDDVDLPTQTQDMADTRAARAARH